MRKGSSASFPGCWGLGRGHSMRRAAPCNLEHPYHATAWKLLTTLTEETYASIYWET